jgi:hypothetical protein
MATRSLTALCLCSAVVLVPRVGLCQADEVGTTPVPAASSPTFLASQPGQFRVSKPEMPGFSQMVRPLGGDFKRLFRRENLRFFRSPAWER